MIKFIYILLSVSVFILFGNCAPAKSEQAFYICHYFHNGDYPRPSKYNNTLLSVHRYWKRCNSEVEYVCLNRFKMKLAENKPAYRPSTNPEPNNCGTPESIAWNKQHQLLQGGDEANNSTTSNEEQDIKTTTEQPESSSTTETVNTSPPSSVDDSINDQHNNSGHSKAAHDDNGENHTIVAPTNHYRSEASHQHEPNNASGNDGASTKPTARERNSSPFLSVHPGYVKYKKTAFGPKINQGDKRYFSFG